MIRSSACQPWQPDLPGHAGDRGDLLSYTTPWDTIRSDHSEGRSRRSHSSQTSLFCETYRIPLAGGSRAWTKSLDTVHAAGFLFAGAKALRSLSCLALNPRRRDADLVHRQVDQPANGG